MKTNMIILGLFSIATLILSGCSSKAMMFEAVNGKSYYIDKKICDSYKLKKDAMYCYSEENSCQATIYQPVTSGCQSKICGPTHTFEK